MLFERHITIGSSAISLSPGTSFVVGTDTWTPETGSFVANSTSELLTIQNPVAGQQITFIDNISVTGPSAIPEPSALPLTGVVAALMLGIFRHRRSTGD